MSWVEVPDGVKMPTTTTYERAIKRNRANFDAYWKASGGSSDSPQARYNVAMSNYYSEQKRMRRVNRFRQKHGRAPLAMPKRPTKASFGMKGG